MLIFVLATGVGQAQVTFQIAYGNIYNDACYHVQQTTDGGYILCGRIEDPLVVGEVYLVKINSSGDTLWTKSYGGPGDEAAYCVRQTTDGGYILTGFTHSFAGGWLDSDIFLIKTNSSGDTLWTKTYRGPSSNYGKSVVQTTDGGYLIAGDIYSYDEDICLIKTNSSGDILWTKTYGGASSEFAESVQCTNDGGYIIVGSTASFGAGASDVYLIRIDSVGDTLWTKTFGGYDQDYGYHVQQTSDGGFIISGMTESFGTNGGEIYLIKTDSNGTLNWSKTHGLFFGDEYGYSVQQTNDGGYVIAGSFVLIINNWPVPFLYLMKTDSIGNAIWVKNYGIGYDVAHSVQLTTDGGFIIAGKSLSVGPGGDDIFLIKTDENGNSGCNETLYSFIPGNPATIQGQTATQIGNAGATLNPSWLQRSTPTIDTVMCYSLVCDTLLITFNVTNMSCNGIQDGQLTAYVSGGSPPYTFLWSTGSTNMSVSGLSAGTYYITITDVNACSGMDSAVITEPSALNVTLSSTQTSNSSVCDGTATVAVSGGISPYTYLWDSNAGFQTTSTADSLCGGNYCVTVTDNNGCSSDTCVEVITGVYNTDFVFAADLYPNPSTGLFFLELKAGKPLSIEIEIRNILGQTVFFDKPDPIAVVYRKQLDLRPLPGGVYMIRLTSEDRVLVKRMIIQ